MFDGQALRRGASLLMLILLLSSATLAADRGDVIEGRARVVDGDTIEVAGVRVRLNGVAAPERSEPGGAEATKALREIIGSQAVRCSLFGQKSHKREIGVCWVGIQDIGAAVIAAGRARDCPGFSDGRYAAVERPSASALPLPDYCQ